MRTAAVLTIAMTMIGGLSACAHPATPDIQPVALSSPAVVVAPAHQPEQRHPVDPDRCYSRERTPVLPPEPPGGDAKASIFGRDTAMLRELIDADGKRGSLDKEIIRRIIRRHIGEVKACYEKELVARPALGGEIVVAFLVPASGFVSETHVARSTMDSRAVEDCVGRAMCGWQFPEPLSGHPVLITYPYRLTPSGGENEPAGVSTQSPPSSHGNP